MKVVINGCFGGFGLSPDAVAAIAKRKGRECYFFNHGYATDAYTPMSIENARKDMMAVAFDVPNPGEVLAGMGEWDEMSSEARVEANRLYRDHNHSARPDDRTDPDLVAVVEELGEKANGACADLRVVEVPDGVEWELDEYDGVESIHESHRSWS